jgi:hypothetical protein
MKRLHLTIPEPCHENWSQMTPVEKGRFCVSCQKNVYDFTKSTDREIIQAYEKDKNLCGRFLNTQLDRELMIPKERKSIWLASLFFAMISLWNTKTSAQEKPKTEQTDLKNQNSGKTDTKTPSQTEGKTITGIVSDEVGPLPGAIVTVKGTNRSAQTDFQGKYTISAQQGEMLVFSFMGMYDLTKTVGYSNIMNVALKDNTDELKSILIGSVSEGKFNRSVEIWK